MVKIHQSCTTKIPVPGEAHGTRFRMATLKAHVWPMGRRNLRVYFIGGDEQIKEKVRFYARQWEEHAGIKFDFGEDIDSEIRIAFDMSENKSWSYIGTQALDFRFPKPTMNFGWLDADTTEEEFQRVVLHEFGHALGCVHEHLRPDAHIPWETEALYQYYIDMGWKKEEVDRDILEPLQANDLDSTEKLDTESIMMYRIKQEHVTDPAWAIGDNHELSLLDKEKMSFVYKKLDGQ